MAKRITKELRDFVPILIKNGYHEVRSKGSHFTYSTGTNQITVNFKLNNMVKQRLIKENNLII